MSKSLIALAIQCGGLIVTVIGVALLSVPAALVVAGVGIGAFGVAYERG